MLGERTGILSPAILFSALTISLSLAWAYADLLLMLLALAMLIALRQWRSSGSPRWLVLGGALAGFALGAKYTAALVPLSGAVMIAAYPACAPQGSRIKRFKSSVLSAGLFSVAALIVFAPWLIKNLWHTGNPVYPFLWPGGRMDALKQWFYSRPYMGERNPLWAALIFFRAVFWGAQSANGYDATLGPLIVFLPFALAVGWRALEARVRNELGPLIVFVLTGYAGWVTLTLASELAIQIRLFFALFPALAILSAAGLTAIGSFDSPALRVSIIIKAVVALILALTAWENLATLAARSPLAYLVGAQSAASFREAHLGAYPAAIERVNALPPGSRVEFLWETRSLDCVELDRCRPDVVIYNWWHLRQTVGAAEAILSHWKAQGVTHVLIYDLGADFVRSQADAAFVDSDWTELDALRGRMQLIQTFDSAYSLYALR